MTKTVTAEPPVIDFTCAPTAGNAVAVAEAPTQMPALPPESATILQIIERAARDPSVDIDKMERLILMQERVQSKLGQVEYDNAMSDAQSGMKMIRANLHNKQTNSDYASYAALDKAVRPIYSAHGFSLSFDSGEGAPENCVRIVCKVAHRGGHRERHQLDMPADGKGAKGGDVMTKTHATGAAITYGKRYMLGMIFNLAVGEDDDGNGAGGIDDDVESLAPKNAQRDGNGKLLSTYNADRANKARDWADSAIQYINLGNTQQAEEWRRGAQMVPQGKRKSPLGWLKDNSPGQYLRVQQAYQNVTGEDLE